MKESGLLVLAILLAGCATALDRERQCFESVTAEYLTAQEELLKLDAVWRATSRRADTLADDAARVDIRIAHQRLQDARTRLQPTLEWYERLYDRLRLRSEEEEMLADTRLLLLTGPAVLFYPVVRWNLRAVLWDGADPDAESDPVARYCTARLAHEKMELGKGLNE
jgi:hypothetical protein